MGQNLVATFDLIPEFSLFAAHNPIVCKYSSSKEEHGVGSIMLWGKDAFHLTQMLESDINL